MCLKCTIANKKKKCYAIGQKPNKEMTKKENEKKKK